MRKAGTLFFIALLALSFCSKSKAGASGSSASRDGQAAGESRSGEGTAGGAAPRIKAVALSPEAPTVLDDVSAVPELEDPEAEGVDFNYQWFINGQESPDADGPVLDKSHYRKGAWLYCRVQSVYQGEESEWFKSDVIRVHNSLPALDLAPVGSFAIPGDFRYQAAASDPDNDELTYELLAPLDQGIAFDARTGALSWRLDAETVGRVGESVEIKIAVSDGEGEKVTGSVTLQFTSTKKKAEPI